MWKGFPRKWSQHQGCLSSRTAWTVLSDTWCDSWGWCRAGPGAGLDNFSSNLAHSVILGNDTFYMVTRGYLLQHEVTRQTNFLPLLQFVSSFQKEINRRKRRRSVCTETVIIFRFSWILSAMFFVVCAGVWRIFCFIEHFLNRLGKTLLGFGHKPSSQDLFPASANKKRPPCFACSPFPPI